MARPSTINATWKVEADGTKVTVADAIARAIAEGNYVETAAKLAGVSKVTVYDWLKRGARARMRAIKTDSPIARADRPYVAFLNAVDEAEAEAEARDVRSLANLGNGGIHVETVTVKVAVDAEGNEKELERTTRTERTLPDARVLMWRLERRHTERWGRLGSLEVTGPNGAPPLSADERAKSLAAAMEEYLQGVADGDARAEERTRTDG